MKERATGLLGILGVAFALRLTAVLWLSDTVPYSDAAYYHLAAQKMAADWTFAFDRSQVEYYGKLGWWPPLYPAFLSLLYRMFGASPRIAAFAQVGLGTLLVALVYRLAQRIMNRDLARLAALLVALNPTYIFLTNILASENLFVIWMTAGLLLAGDRFASRRRAAWAGVTLACGALTRAIGLVVLPVVALAHFKRAADRRTGLVACAWLLGTAALVIAPWTVRNALVAGSPALVCFGGGLNFYFGHNAVRIGYRDLAQTPMAQLPTQAAIDREGYRLGLGYLQQAPVGFFTRGGHKLVALFGAPRYAPHANSAIMLPEGWQTDPEKGRQATILRNRQREKNRWLDGLFSQLATLHTWILILGSVVAVMRWRRLPPQLRLYVWLCAAWIGSHILFWGQPRFRYPMEIPLALLAAWAILDGAKRDRRRGVAVAMVCIALSMTGCASSPPPPAIESWGDTAHPFDDPIEVAAVNALGPRPFEYRASPVAPMRLGEFLLLSNTERSIRTNLAHSVIPAIGARGLASDSLPPYLEAIRIDPSLTSAYFEAARILVAREATARAHALLSQGLRLEWRQARPWALMGSIYIQEGDDKRARAALEHALTLDPKFPGVHEALITVYLRVGETARADSLLRHAPATLRPYLEPYLAGMVAQSHGDFEAARSAFQTAASDSNAVAAVLIAWGNAEYKARNLPAAETAYRRALHLEPALPAARLGLGVTQRAQGDLAGAVSTFQHLVRAHPRQATAQFNLAGTSLELAQKVGRGARGDALLAVADSAFSACVSLDFRASESRLRRAEVHLLRGDPATAYNEARALCSDSLQAADARILAGRAAMAARRPQDVVVTLAPAFRADSLSVDGLDLLGNAYLQLELPAYATRVLRRAHERRPDAWRTSVNLGIALAQSNDLVGAEAILREQAQAHPDEPYVLQNLAAVLQRTGKRDEAQRLLRHVDSLRAP